MDTNLRATYDEVIKKGRVKMEKQTRKRIPKETQDYIVKMILEEGIKIREMARKFEIGESTIQRWLKAVRDQKKQEATGSKFITTKEHEKMQAQYEKELRALKEENDILKKAMHIFAKNHE